MNLSYNWLTDYVDLANLPAAELADLLTMKTCEVEGVEDFLPHLNDIKVALVEKVERHPDADKLVVCQVSSGSQKLQIVTGAPNVKEGKKYPLAGVGVTLPGGMTMKKAKLRGLESEGMLCSEGELGLEEVVFPEEFEAHEDGILTLPDAYESGKSLSEYLPITDIILDIDNKSITHRPDLWSHYGFAREIAALTGKKLKFDPAESKFKSTASVDQSLGAIAIEIKGEAAINYSGALLDGVDVRASSLQMQGRLLAAGMRPINNVVDVSNYVMLDLGQPNHAFDRNQLKTKIEISESKDGETIITLDEKEHKLPAGIVLIRDGKRPVALGGVMGGQNTEVSDDTTQLFLESATFHRHHIRKAVSQLGVRTEASQRFEKGQDATNAAYAIHRFANLLAESCPELKMGKVNSEFKEKPRKAKIKTTISYLKRRLGHLKITDKKIVSILESLGMQCSLSGDALSVTVPSYRSYFDVTIADDLVEEVGRVVGYNEITPQPLMVMCEVPQVENEMRALEHDVRHLMANAYHYSEAYNYAFHSDTDVDADNRLASNTIRLQNPIHTDLAHMRISPLVGLLHNIDNYHKSHPSLRLFEIERVFIPNKKGELPTEKEFLAAAFTSTESADDCLASIASTLSHLLVRLGVPYDEQQWQQGTDEDAVFHPGRRGRVLVNDTVAFRWGQVHPKITDQKGLPSVYYFEALLEDLAKIKNDESHYNPVARYPTTDFEVTVVVDAKRPFAELADAIGNVATSHRDMGNKTYIDRLDHLATYQGEQLEAGKKAVSVRVVWRNNEHTLSGDEVKDLQERLVRKLEHKGFPLR